MSGHDATTPAPGAHDDDADHLRARYRELLEEQRTVLPGVQVLFAFLLTVPFAGRFVELDRTGRIGFTVTLMAAAFSTVLLLSPAAYHRLSDRHARRERLAAGIRLQVTGLALLGVAISVAVFVLARFIFGTGIGIALGGTTAALTVAVWWVHPVSERD